MTVVSDPGNRQASEAPKAQSLDRKMLGDMKDLVKALEDDLRARSIEVPEAAARLQGEYQEAVRAERTRATYETWRDEVITQIAVAWVLACVFVRFLEDNDLVAEVRLAGVGRRRQEAIDAHDAFFRENPRHTDREYLQAVFDDVARLPGCGDLFGRDHNPLWHLGLSGDGAKQLLEFWQQRDATGEGLLRTFVRASGDTRFLGDLYQDLSEAARKRYALLQTPDFVEAFILDYTLAPAVETFGLEGLRMIDPTCGSGHFLLGGFHRLSDHWRREQPGLNEREVARRALGSVFGVDLNPFAVAIARFRLLVAALQFCGIRRLADAPDFHVNVAAGDSLLHGRSKARGEQLLFEGKTWLPDSVARGDYEAATRILSAHYHAVVGNPPYITDKDEAHRETVRQRYDSCHGKFSLGVPFTERFFDLGEGADDCGFIGMITTNSFMKREFGKKLIEKFFPTVELTHVIDTSGAYVPGHGTPTVIMFGRPRQSTEDTVRAVLGIRGEPSTPEDPTQGKVWTSVVTMLDKPGSQNEFVSVVDMPKATLHKHPWSMGGGGALELKGHIDDQCAQRLEQFAISIGFASFPGQDEVFIADRAALRRLTRDNQFLKPFLYGEAIRDWGIASHDYAFAPYDSEFRLIDLQETARWGRYLWHFKPSLGGVVSFGGKTKADLDMPWWGWYRWVPDKYSTPLSIAFAFVSTHNHFVLDRGGKVFKQSAPVIKLPPDKTEEDHLTLLGLLNSSSGAFWLHQVGSNRGASVDQANARQTTAAFENFYDYASTQIARFPVTLDPRVTRLARELDTLAQKREAFTPSAVLEKWLQGTSSCLTDDLDDARVADDEVFETMIFLQEELDWVVYEAYGLLSKEETKSLQQLREAASPGTRMKKGHRAFEIALHEDVKNGVTETTWFTRMQCADPAQAPDDPVTLQRARIIRENPLIRVVEQPEHKRRWQREPWEEMLARHLKSWLLDRLESSRYWPHEPEITTTARLASMAARDAEFMNVAELYRGRPDFDVPALVAELVAAESVPALPALRYTESGLRKRAQWKATWDLQRREDAGENVGKIPVPPKYANTDFQKGDCWRLRGKLDVPKERFVSFPHCERDADGSLPITWAGYDHLQQAKAVAAYYLQCKESDGWTPERLTPLLAALNELVPWLLQWHNDVDPETGERLGDFYAGFLESERRALDLTPDHLTAWRPPKATGKSRGRSKQ